MTALVSSIEADAIAREGVAVLQDALSRLEKLDRVIVMGAALEKSYAEISGEVGISKQAVERRHKRALDVMRRRMASAGYRSMADFGMAA